MQAFSTRKAPFCKAAALPHPTIAPPFPGRHLHPDECANYFLCKTFTSHPLRHTLPLFPKLRQSLNFVTTSLPLQDSFGPASPPGTLSPFTFIQSLGFIESLSGGPTSTLSVPLTYRLSTAYLYPYML